MPPGAVSVALLFRPSRTATRIVSATLAAMWLVNGIGYHWFFFRAINPAAVVFGAVFVLQAVLLLLLPLRRPDGRLEVQRDARSAVGLLLILSAAVLHPIWGWLAGHIWPQMPACGVAPCPTTIFTIGALPMGPWGVVRWLLIVPGLCAGVGGSTALLLGIPQDYTLLAALALLVLFAAGRLANMGFARRAAADAAR
jgi:hypothetical protein